MATIPSDFLTAGVPPDAEVFSAVRYDTDTADMCTHSWLLLTLDDADLAAGRPTPEAARGLSAEIAGSARPSSAVDVFAPEEVRVPSW